MFESLIPTTGITVDSALWCTVASVACGILVAIAYMIKSHYTKNFIITLAMLPLIVQVVIMMVNGNIGTGVAVVGAFSLIRFRSVAGNSKDITTIFLAMSIGIATGMGYVFFALCFTVLACLIFVALKFINLGEDKHSKEKTLKITIPEDLNYTEVFDDIFNKYFTSTKLERVKTTNLGSMFELKYKVILKERATEQKMINDIRCKNGNLPIVCADYKDAEEL